MVVAALMATLASSRGTCRFVMLYAADININATYDRDFNGGFVFWNLNLLGNDVQDVPGLLQLHNQTASAELPICIEASLLKGVCMPLALVAATVTTLLPLPLPLLPLLLLTKNVA